MTIYYFLLVAFCTFITLFIGWVSGYNHYADNLDEILLKQGWKRVPNVVEADPDKAFIRDYALNLSEERKQEELAYLQAERAGLEQY